MPPKQWQNVLDELVTLASSDGTLEDIECKFNEDELVSRFITEPYKKKLLAWISDVCSSKSWMKDKEKAKSLRSEGNTKFLRKDYESCLHIYTESIRYAPMKSEELSLSLANRSAVLFQMKKYEQAITDIDRAFENGYPEHIQYKLHKRKGECLAQIGRHVDAISELGQAQLKLAIVDKSVDANSVLNVIQNLVDHSTRFVASSDHCKSSDKANLPELPLPSLGLNKDLAYASKAISLRENMQKGRHIIAVSDISIGDILFVEKPFASVLLPEHYKHRCHNCCKPFRALIPCSQCIKASFCSESCRKSAWNEYHKWECPGGLNIAHCVGIAHLGLRIVLKAGSLSQHKIRRIKLDKNEADRNDHYFSVYNLISHLESQSAENRAAYALTASCLVFYLMHYTEYFFDLKPLCHVKYSSPQPVSSKDFILIGSLILRHICQLVCNGHAITAVQQIKAIDNIVEDEMQTRIATAIFTSASMMNHSCDPNIINSFSGTTLIVKAYKDIRSGGEVLNCYGPNFRRMSNLQRKSILRTQYFFECKCEPCSNDLEFLENFSAYLCKICKGPITETQLRIRELKCSRCDSFFDHCNLPQDFTTVSIQQARGHELLDGGHIQDALEMLRSCHGLQQKLLYRNHTDLRACADTIAKCYAKLGDFKRASQLIIKETLPVIEEQFGALSIEMAYELQKLTDLMINDLQYSKYDKLTFLIKHGKTMQKLQTAKTIFELHYGTWDPSLQQVMQKEECLNSMLNHLSPDPIMSGEAADPT